LKDRYAAEQAKEENIKQNKEQDGKSYIGRGVCEKAYGCNGTEAD
jgi:hypothetical protein